MTASLDVRSSLIDLFRRDLVGPGLAGRRHRQGAPERESVALVSHRLSGAGRGSAGARRARGERRSIRPFRRDGDSIARSPRTRAPAAPPATTRRPRRQTPSGAFCPPRIGLTVLLPPDVTEIEARVCWGDYRTEPPLPEELFLPDEPDETSKDGKRKEGAAVRRMGARAQRANGPPHRA